MEEKEEKKLSKSSKIRIIVAVSVVAVILVSAVIAIAVYASKVVRVDDTYKFEVAEGCSDFYYDKLSANQKKLYEMMYKEVEEALHSKKSIDTLGIYRFSDYNLSKEDAVTVWYALRYDAASLFIISNTYVNLPDSIVLIVAKEFSSAEVRQKVFDSLELSVEQVKQLLKGIDDEALKFKIIYDYVMNSTFYQKDENDKDLFNGYTCSIVGALDGDDSTGSICQGYAQSISYLCNIFGVDCAYVGSESAGHALNIANIKGKWYYADAHTEGRIGEMEYKYFLNGRDKFWRDIIAPSGNASRDFLINCLPQLESHSYGEYGILVSDGVLTYRVVGRKKCVIQSCYSDIKSVVVPSNFGNMTVMSISGASFYKNSNLTSVKISDGIMSIGDLAFQDCINLTSVELPESITSIGIDAFKGCRNLKSVKIPSSVTIIASGAFKDCIGLTDIEIPEGVTEIWGQAFANCANLKRVVIPSSLYDMKKEAFKDCSNLTSIEIPEGLWYIGEYAFSGCNKLTIYCQASEEPIVWDEKWNYYNRPVVWNSGNIEHGVTDSGMQWCMTDEGTIAISGYGGSLSKVEIPSEINGRSVTSILESAFIERKDIISIDIPASVAYVGKNAFKYCGKMAIYCQVSEKPAGWDVEWNPSRQRVIWNNSPNDHDVTHDGIQWRLTDEGTVEIMGYSADAFQFKIPSTIDGKVVSAISADAFDDCDRLTRVEIPIGITKIGSGVFDGCMSLIIYCEAESKQIGWEYNWRSGRPVVWNCKYNDVADDGNVYLTADNGMNYTLDNGKATLVSVFKAISGDVVIPASVVYKDVEYKVTGIGDETFRNIKSVTSVKISNGIESIGESAFSNCDNLFSVEIPNSMISIGSHAFAFCSELRNIWIPKSVEYMGESVFQRFGNDYILCAYCEAESKPIGWDEKWSVRYYDQWMGRYSYNSYVFGSTGIGIY